MADVKGDSSTTATIGVGGTVTGTIDVAGDHDWFRINLTAGQEVTVTLNGITLADPYVRIRDANGNLLCANDDVSPGVDRDSQISFGATYSGAYYIDVAAWFDPTYGSYPGDTGDYQLSVTVFTPPPLWTNDQIAQQLTSGYWDGETHKFDLSDGRSITVNLTALTPAGQNLAREALALWSDVIGVTFVEVTTPGGGEITFDDNEEGAQTSSDYPAGGGFITTSHVNISTQWLTDYGSGLGSYSFQTYIHEIGHALGLGHTGNYNFDPDAPTAGYPYDVLFKNDAWSESVMSYFSQTENTYYRNQGFTYLYLGTPMAADILAMSQLYGLSTTTRAGDTTYGFNSNAGRSIYNASLYPNVALTIFDSGGSDTLDYSAYSGSQLINLVPETFSNVLGRTGNLAIARGTVIERAIGGSGSDTITGNDANNVLDGRAGTDTLNGGAGNDILNGGDGNDTLYDASGSDILDGGAGSDSIFVDLANGFSASDQVRGGSEYDTLFISGAPLQTWQDLSGFQIGTDVEALVSTQAWFALPSVQAAGFERLEIAALKLTTAGSLTASPNFRVYQIYLSDFGNSIDLSQASPYNYRVFGGAGNDVIVSSSLADTLTGGAGNDTFRGTTGELTGDVVTDFRVGDKMVFTDASLATFTFSVSGSTLTYSGGSLTLQGGVSGTLVASAATGGGVQLTIGQPIVYDVANDFNGDGRSDVLLRNINGSITDWLGQTNGGFFSNHVAASYGLSTSWQVAATGDFNGDGRDDVLLRHDNGTITDWLGQTNGGFFSNHAVASYGLDLGWQVAGAGDFNGDGRDDVLLRHSSGAITNWLGNGNGSFFSNHVVANYSLPSGWGVAGIGDFNGDGRDDLLLRNTNGTITEWLGREDGGFFSNHAAVSYALPSSWHVAGIGDFNGDNRDDVLLRNDNGTITDWLGQPDGSFFSNHAVATYSLDMAWEAAQIGDFNGDERDDVLLRHANGTVTDWLGAENGSFFSNHANATYVLPTGWHVEPDALWV